VKRQRDESGQIIVLVAVAAAGFMVMAALVIGVGIYYHSQRQLQSSIDAAALAGAQDLPGVGGSIANSQATANTTFNQNLTNNPDAESGSASTPSFMTSFPNNPGCSPAICIGIDVDRPASLVLTNVNAHAHAQAFLGIPSSAANVSAAPIYISQACIPSAGCSLPQSVTLTLPANAPLLDLNTHSATDDTIQGTNNSTNTMDGWLTTGYNSSSCSPQPTCTGELPVNQWYAVDPGDKNGVKSQGLDPDITNGTIIVIPVYDSYYPSGPIKNATAYHVIGFAAIKLTSDTPWNGNQKQLQGTLVNYIATGLSGGPCSTCQNFGVFVVGLNG
jgi:hypothetical protein